MICVNIWHKQRKTIDPFRKSENKKDAEGRNTKIIWLLNYAKSIEAVMTY